jgi:ribosomal protein L29
MNMKEILKNDKDGMKKMLVEKKQALQQFRFNMQGSKIKNVREGRELRKDVARINTALKAAK